MKSKCAILLVSCQDKEGLVATITEFIYKNGGNIVDLDQLLLREGSFPLHLC